MSHGHTLPLLDLSQALCLRGVAVTFITTPLNLPHITSKLSNHYPQISIRVLPFPQVPDLPEGCENTAQLPSPALFLPFFRAIEMMKQPFEAVLREMSDAGCLPICVISDFFLGWTLDSCRLFDIPRFVSHGMGLLPMVVIKAAYMQGASIKSMADSDQIKLPQVDVQFPLIKGDSPDSVRESATIEDPWVRFIAEVGEADNNSSGIILNSFQELEGEHVATFESFYKGKANAWCVGPLFLMNNQGGDHDQCCPYINWLNEQQEVQNSVVYVSFGTQSQVSDIQMDEIAMGLEMAGHPFIWVVRSTTWSPPEGWEERVKEFGMVARNWVDQRSILAHPSTGGFLSHCGWNSVLESLSGGVPLLGWPMGAEQGLNAKYVAEGLGAGILVPQGTRVVREGIEAVGRDVICDGVKELMGGERGRRAREMAEKLGVMARKAVEKGGSSDQKLDELIESLTNGRKDEEKVYPVHENPTYAMSGKELMYAAFIPANKEVV